LSPVHILEDGYDAARTREMEALRERLGISRDDVFYGYGGSLVARGELTRDRVAAVYKLTETDGLPVMKFSVPSKRSVPGRPVVWRRVSGQGPLGIIAQDGELVRDGYVVLTASDRIVDVAASTDVSVERSPATLALERQCEERRA